MNINWHATPKFWRKNPSTLPSVSTCVNKTFAILFVITIKFARPGLHLGIIWSFSGPPPRERRAFDTFPRPPRNAISIMKSRMEMPFEIWNCQVCYAICPRHFLLHPFYATRKKERERDVWHIWRTRAYYYRFTRQSNRIINVAIEIPCLFIGTYVRDRRNWNLARDDSDRSSKPTSVKMSSLI